MSRFNLLAAAVLGMLSIAGTDERAGNPANNGESDRAASAPGAASCPPGTARGTLDARSLAELAMDVAGDDAAVVTAAVAKLRGAGPDALAALFETHRGLLDASAGPPGRDADPQLARLNAALDAVGAQRNCRTSRLYWYTDLAAAAEAARRESKPILSLRLLGELTDEFSCANSRYFRTSLYANHEIDEYLRTHFILHWQTVRPVPRVTIDFGDGRKLERTLTGNSIHWVLDTAGRPFDALPGLYGPQAFLRELKRIETAIRNSAAVDEASRDAFFVLFHQQRLEAIQQVWQRDLAELKITIPGSGPAPADAGRKGAGAVAAGTVTRSKSIVEFPLLQRLAFATEPFRQATTEDVWLKLGALHHEDAQLDAASVELIHRENPPGAAGDPATGNSLSPDEALAAMVGAFQAAMAVDTVRNEYELHRQLHEWFVAGAGRDLEALNERVYAELFLTPRSDRWLGLVPADAYTGLERGGRRE
jgi:hypothetical protein